MQMPEMDGLMLATAIKAEPAIAATRLVMLSSLGKHLDTTGFKAAGIEEYLVKPVKQSRLYDCLVEVMDRRDSTTTTPGAAALVPAGPAAPHAERVLLAEDNMINQKVAVRQLAKLGYHADTVANGNEVMEALERFAYNIILMDCQMPDLDGYETTRLIRSEHSRPIYIIAMTANAMQGDREKCLTAGMDDYVTKPVRTEELEAALARYRPAPAVNPPVDFEQLRDAADHDPGEMRALTALFLEQADELMPGLATALATGAANEVDKLAHKLAGSCASCGMVALLTALRELEQMGRSGDLTRAAECHERVIATLDETRHFLNTHFSQAALEAAAC